MIENPLENPPFAANTVALQRISNNNIEEKRKAKKIDVEWWRITAHTKENVVEFQGELYCINVFSN